MRLQTSAWRSADGADRLALSLACPRGRIRDLGRDIAGARCSFLILDLTPRSEGWLAEACAEAAGLARFQPRVVIAVSSADLLVSPGSVQTQSVGFALDVADEHVPFSAFLDDRIEALRFAPEFVSRATSRLRTRCVLDSMLRLARDVGLTTLGPQADVDPRRAANEADFDYVPAERGRGPDRTASRFARTDFELSR